MKAIRTFFNSTFKLYAETLVEENSNRDLTTKFFRGVTPLIISVYAYSYYRDGISDVDPIMLEYWDLEIDKERTKNYSEEKLKEWRNFKAWREKMKSEGTVIGQKKRKEFLKKEAQRQSHLDASA